MERAGLRLNVREKLPCSMSRRQARALRSGTASEFAIVLSRLADIENKGPRLSGCMGCARLIACGFHETLSWYVRIPI
jgi:hypothetical protein